MNVFNVLKKTAEPAAKLGLLALKVQTFPLKISESDVTSTIRDLAARYGAHDLTIQACDNYMLASTTLTKWGFRFQVDATFEITTFVVNRHQQQLN